MLYSGFKVVSNNYYFTLTGEKMATAENNLRNPKNSRASWLDLDLRIFCQKIWILARYPVSLTDAFVLQSPIVWREIHRAHGTAAALPGGPHTRTEQDVQPTRERRVAGEYEAASFSDSL